MQDIILLKQGEIVLKGLNKKYFEQKLISNVKRRLRSLGEFDVTCTQSTIYVEPKSDDIDMDETQQAMTKVFGIAAVVRAAACGKTPEAMAQKAIEYMAEAMREAGSFKVETRRADIDKIGSDKVRVLLVEECGVEEAKADEILTFIAIRGTNGEVLSALEQYRGRNEVFDQGLDELSSVTKLLGAFGVPEENFAVDLTIARGLDYYTGTVYETTLLDHPEIGSVCSGGRYDNLAEYYTDRPLPGVGISIGLTRLFYVLSEQRMLNEERVMAPADVMIVPMTDDLEAAVRLATELRAQNIRVQLYTEQKKFKAKIQYADKLHIPYVVFLGEDEIAAGTVSLKDLRTGDQVTVPAQDAAARILADIELRGQGTILK